MNNEQEWMVMVQKCVESSNGKKKADYMHKEKETYG